MNHIDNGFTKTTKHDFTTHLYGNIFRCCFRNNILHFFSSEKEATGLSLFFFSHNNRYYRALRNANLPDSILEQQIMNFLYSDYESFMYRGWLCKFDTKERIFHLYTPCELEQPASFRVSEMEVSTPEQAIEFINYY